MRQKTITHSMIALMSALALAGCGGGGSGGGIFDDNTGDDPVDTTYPTPDTTKNPNSRENATLANTMKQLSTVIPGVDTNGTATGEDVRPLLVTYLQQVKGDYETGDGSADIGDPYHVDGVFASLSLDNGKTWKRFEISDTSDKWSATVEWAGDKNFRYPGHAQRPTFAAYGNNIMVAWNDKYCPSGDPLNLGDADSGYPDDYFGVNGNQKYVDYEGIVAPNGKTVYQVPFSCVWTARGIFDPATNDIIWHAPMQLTSGVRDSNKIWIEASASGFAMTWQEDPEGLRSGKGEGPGDGWSGATTNHGADIWYSSLRMGEEFNATVPTDDSEVKPQSLNNFHYPVRITDNQKCKVNDANSKPYCQYLCATYGDPDGDGSCNTGYMDMLDDTNVTLNGDTGASRPALKILNDGTQDIVILGYEETKGLSESNPGVPNNESPETIIELEGKSVYFESFAFEAFYGFNMSEGNASMNVKADDSLDLPLVSAGNIVNLKVPDQNDETKLIYENARRLIIGTQIDPENDAHDYKFAFLYKQGVETQGGSSDMYVRVNNGYTYDTFVALPDANLSEELNATNVSAQPYQSATSQTYAVNWTPANLKDSSFANNVENTFSPRIFLRGYDIFVGYVYTPSDNQSNQFNMPINFHHNIYTCDEKGLNCYWQGPVNVTGITKASVTTVDPRFVPTAKETTGLTSDTSNPNVMFLTWGTMEGKDEERAEGNIYYKRGFKQTDGTWVWDANQSAISALIGSNPTEIEEEQVQTFATPDGSMLFNVWIQETEYDVYAEHPEDRDYGLGTWFKRLDFNSTSDTNGTTAIDVNDTGSMLVSK